MALREAYTMPGRACAKYLWMSPSKVRRVLPHLKGRSIQDAIDVLRHVSHGSSVQLQKVINSATANYTQKFPQANTKLLYLKHIYADDGPRAKRIWRRGRGRADVLLKRMCHITALVDAHDSVPRGRRSPARYAPARNDGSTKSAVGTVNKSALSTVNKSASARGGR